MAEIEGTLVAGKYRVKRRIGVGGMGAVYEGEHVEIGKRVAIKVIEHEHARSEELAARFRREARAASAVESEHIVHVFDVGQDETVGLYMVMEILSGEDLASRLEKAGGRIPVEEAVTIATQAARALAKAHVAGVVHRDLKPANLFLTEREDGTVCVKLLDFGISKLVKPGTEDGKSSTLTRAGSVMGTPMYMSPEQAQGLPVDARTDIWSLASVLYEALCGRTPYAQRDTYEQMIVQIVTTKPRPIAEIAPWVPEAIARVVEGALEHDTAARSADAGAFAKQLSEAAKIPAAPSSSRLLSASAPASERSPVSGSTGASPPTGTGVVVGARTQLEAGLPAKRSPAMIIAVAAGALLLVAGGVALMTRGPAQPPPAGPASGLVAPPASSEPSLAPSAPATTAVVILAAPPEPTTVADAAPPPPRIVGAKRPNPPPPPPASAPAKQEPARPPGGAGTATGYY